MRNDAFSLFQFFLDSDHAQCELYLAAALASFYILTDEHKYIRAGASINA